jgi:predicted RNA-binding protein with PIN domain
MTARREILIDAYNVLYADPRLNALMRRDVERAREEFVAWVAVRLPPESGLGVVVFDAMRDPRPVTETGRAHTSMQRGLQIVYARDSADTWIRDRIRTHAQPALLTIVTSDREILETARTHGAGILRVSEFLQLGSRQKQRLREIRDREKPEHQSRREIAEWERLFGERPDEE